VHCLSDRSPNDFVQSCYLDHHPNGVVSRRRRGVVAGPARQARNPYPPARLRRAANDERRYRGPAARMRMAQSPRYRRTRPADPWAGISSIRMKGLPLQREGSEHSDDTSGAKDRRSVRERYLGSFPKHRTP